jgi:hypothetical protein
MRTNTISEGIGTVQRCDKIQWAYPWCHIMDQRLRGYGRCSNTRNHCCTKKYHSRRFVRYLREFYALGFKFRLWYGPLFSSKSSENWRYFFVMHSKKLYCVSYETIFRSVASEQTEKWTEAKESVAIAIGNMLFDIFLDDATQSAQNSDVSNDIRFTHCDPLPACCC